MTRDQAIACARGYIDAFEQADVSFSDTSIRLYRDGSDWLVEQRVLIASWPDEPTKDTPHDR